MNKREIDIALEHIARGDNIAFERLYIETRRGVYAFMFSYFNNRADCEDAMQTVYLKVKQNIGQYKIGSNGLAWILKIAKNTALNELRANANYEKRKQNTDNSYEYTYDDRERKDILITVMKRVLDEDEQRIIVLHVVWGYKHKEIAKILKCPVGTVTSKYKRAADKLKSAWKEEQL